METHARRKEEAQASRRRRANNVMQKLFMYTPLVAERNNRNRYGSLELIT